MEVLGDNSDLLSTSNIHTTAPGKQCTSAQCISTWQESQGKKSLGRSINKETAVVFYFCVIYVFLPRRQNTPVKYLILQPAIWEMLQDFQIYTRPGGRHGN